MLFFNSHVCLRFLLANIEIFYQHIEEVSFRSNFFSSEVTKLLAVVLRDVRINKDVGNDSDGVKSSQHLPDDWSHIDFRNKKIPPSIITFAQVQYKYHTLICHINT